MVHQPSARTVATLVAALVILGAVFAWALAQVRHPQEPEPVPQPFGMVLHSA